MSREGGGGGGRWLELHRRGSVRWWWDGSVELIAGSLVSAYLWVPTRGEEVLSCFFTGSAILKSCQSLRIKREEEEDKDEEEGR